MHKELNKLYAKTQFAAPPSGRRIEIAILQLAASRLRAFYNAGEPLRWSPELSEALTFNRKVWDVFIADWSLPDCQLPQELRKNLLNLGAYVRQATLQTLANPVIETVKTLVQINDNLVEGLSNEKKPDMQTKTS